MRTAEKNAAKFRVRGLVQGVGFRPFVYRLARTLGLAGWVRNDSSGVLIHAEGPANALSLFEQRLRAGAPAAAVVGAVACRRVPPAGYRDFRVTPSRSATPHTDGLRVPPDRAVCAACRADVADPADRRFGYPFATCTDCGPRYSVLHRLPYDRPATGMERFRPCPECRAEYEDPETRRFHAETLACPACGPQAALRDGTGRLVATRAEAIREAARHLREGRVLALKGLGGFQLRVRADSSEAVARLRQRKARPFKPFAVMVPSLERARLLAHVGPTEADLLARPENPIILLDLLPGVLAPEVSPRLRRVGLMLPTTPLHGLLMAEVAFPVVATSGNRGDEPIVTDEADAFASLAGIADAFLVHDRPIVRRADDSVIAVIGARPVAVRLARGYSPLPLPALERWANRRGLARTSLLATGGQQKVAPALWMNGQAVLGPHVGDLDGVAAQGAYRRLVEELAALYGGRVGGIACDRHPDYFTTRWARASGLPVAQVQHHHAHAVSCMVEHDLLDREVLALTWDGTGYGPDGTVWGGEALRVTARESKRVASLRPFPLPSGEAAVREPNRVALALLADALGAEAVLGDDDILGRLGLSAPTARVLLRMAARGINTPLTSSMGRLFDAAAALVLGVTEVSYEGEAAAWLEAVADERETGRYPLPNNAASDGLLQGDGRPLFRALLDDMRQGAEPATCAARFHNALAAWAAAVAAQHPGLDVVLTGGCFLNALLTTRVEEALRSLGRRVYRHSQVPPGDGGLAAGQLAVGLALMASERGEVYR